MKHIFLSSVLLSTCIALSGCSDDVLEESKPLWHEGDGIVFGALAGVENTENKKDSRTVYTGKYFQDENNKDIWYEQLHWVVGDNISIYSPEAHVTGSGQFADYVVTNEDNQSTNGNTSVATLKPKDASNALQWGGTGVHHFMACYPTEAVTSQGNKSGIQASPTSDGSLEIVGRVANNQIPKEITKDAQGNFTAVPYMYNAHMVAVDAASVNDPTVNLTFKSVCTVLQVELVGHPNQETMLTGVLIGSDTQEVAGRYTCTLAPGTSTSYPACTKMQHEAEQDGAGNQIMIPLMRNIGTDKEPKVVGTPLEPGKKLTLTVFLLPTVDYKDLKITIITPSGRKSHLLQQNVNGTLENLDVSVHKKHYLNNITLPKSFDSANWMSRIDDKVLVSELSIPGSGDSYSYLYQPNGNDSVYYKKQVKTIEQQWNFGVRCFEITTDRQAEHIGSLSGATIVGEGQMGTIDAAITDINAKVTGIVNAQGQPTEFAIIILNYQPTADEGNLFGRDSKAYMRQCNNFIQSLSKTMKVVAYHDGMTLKEARGGLMFIVRPTSDGEDMWDEKTKNKYVNKNYMIVHGWGSLQDKWKQRGYVKSDNQPVANLGKGDFTNSYEKSILKEQEYSVADPDFTSFSPYKISNAAINYEYTTNLPVTVWAQEWSRVVENDIVVYVDYKPGWKLFAAWKSSYKEKLDAAENTFIKATTTAATNTLFINCLTGYFLDPSKNKTQSDADLFVMPNHDMPAWPAKNGGKYGNVISFAKRINQDFYQFIWTKWNERITAPMGIVMMDRIGDGTEKSNPGNFYLPGIVISNNFSFPLKTGTVPAVN